MYIYIYISCDFLKSAFGNFKLIYFKMIILKCYHTKSIIRTNLSFIIHFSREFLRDKSFYKNFTTFRFYRQRLFNNTVYYPKFG